ncbi:MAG: Na+ dependent nucleoside transporter N-terminal domain-containing protein [Nocardioidaceae bacterium]
MDQFRGLLGLLVLLAVAFAVSRNRFGISLRTVIGALALQFGFALLVLRWPPGERALQWVSERLETLIGYTEEGTAFLFGPLLGVAGENQTVFALQVLPVIVFLGALVGLLFYLRVIQYPTFVIGGAIAKALGISKVESMYGSTVIFLGQSEAPLMISPYLRTLRTPAMFTVMTSGFAAAGFANFASIAIQIGTIASLQPDPPGTGGTAGHARSAGRVDGLPRQRCHRRCRRRGLTGSGVIRRGAGEVCRQSPDAEPEREPHPDVQHVVGERPDDRSSHEAERHPVADVTTLTALRRLVLAAPVVTHRPTVPVRRVSAGSTSTGQVAEESSCWHGAPAPRHRPGRQPRRRLRPCHAARLA